MTETSPNDGASLEVISRATSCRAIRVTESPFFIERGETRNHLRLPDHRISRQFAAIVSQGGCYRLEGRGHSAATSLTKK